MSDPRREEQMENIARIVEAEVLDMVAAGAREVQLDASVEMIALNLGAQGPQEIAQLLLFPFRSRPQVRRTIHFCLGDMGKRPFTETQNLRTLLPLLQLIAGDVDRVHIECSYAGQWEELSLLAEVPAQLEVIAGIADVKREPSSVDELTRKLERLVELLPPKRLLVSSSCGCGRCSPEAAKALMSALVEATHRV